MKKLLPDIVLWIMLVIGLTWLLLAITKSKSDYVPCTDFEMRGYTDGVYYRENC